MPSKGNPLYTLLIMYVNYNANPSGKATGDCVIRAISAVTGLPWRIVHWDLATLSNEMNQFNQFWQGIQGNPQRMVQNMLQNGQMSQDQFTQLSNVANQIMPFIRR